jgi:hypothetical protein
MEEILNDNIDYPKAYVIESFKNRSFVKTMVPKGTSLYRIVTKEDPINKVHGNNFVSGEFWIDHDTFIKISSKVNYDIPSKTITDLARNGLAITSKFSITADSIIGITLMQDAYAWKGTAARQLETSQNGMKKVYRGGLTQLWIPNLNEKIVRFKFFHSI